MINFDSMETKTETYTFYLVEINVDNKEIDGKKDWRFVFKFKEEPEVKSARAHAVIFLNHERDIHNYVPKTYQVRIRKVIENRIYTSGIKYI